MKTLVAYFSAGGVTAKAAQKIAAATGADIFEIKPQIPYSEKDLNWRNPLARCNKEKIGKKDVPIEGKIGDIAPYERVYLGFPIWYYGAPNIIETFLKQYDLSGKQLVLFATSGGSDMGKTAAKLQPFLSQTAEVVAAKLIRSADDETAIKEWIDSI